MYRIGMFSKINKVTVKTLRYYDETGLLKPAYVDRENGYRYYTSAQLPLLHKIMALRQTGFSIDEIQSILNGRNIADGEYKEKDIDVEFCEAVTAFGQDTETIRFKKMEKVPAAACGFHKGPYRTIGNAYAQLFRWIADNGYAPSDNPRESYIDGIWNKDGENEWLTELQVPIMKK